MNIGVIGYYGYGNAGDQIILKNIQRIFAPHRCVPLPVGLDYGADTIKRLNLFDFLILGGGGLYREAPPSPFGAFNEWGGELTTPIGVLGLGVSKLAPPFRPAMHSLVEQAAFFLVRDETSRSLIDHPKVQIAPDLTFYEPFTLPRQNPRGREVLCGVNLRPVHAGWADWITAIEQLPCQKRAIPFSSHPTHGEVRALQALDPRCPPTFSIEQYAPLSLLIGTAFHSLVFAIQVGLPVIAINYDPKVQRLMGEIRLEEYMLEWDEWERLPELYEKVLANQDGIEQQMLEYTGQAKRKLANALEEPRKIVASATRPGRPPQPAPGALVSVVVLAAGENDSEIRASVASCLDQTHENVEVLVVAPQAEEGQLPEDFKTDRRVRFVPVEHLTGELPERLLSEVGGEFVVRLRAGQLLAGDAAARMLAAFEDQPRAELVHSDYFLTESGNILCKVRLRRFHTPEKAAYLGPSVMVRKEKLGKYWRWLSEESRSGPQFVSNSRSVYLHNALLYKPASENEKLTYCGLIAFGKGEFEHAEQLLSSASLAASENDLMKADNFVELLTRAARENRILGNPYQFVKVFFEAAPLRDERLRALEARVLANLAMNDFFAANGDLNDRKARIKLWQGIKKDPRWLRNRGVWAMMKRNLKDFFQLRYSS